jgi:uncharacterized damage-inducible protein DinB
MVRLEAVLGSWRTVRLDTAQAVEEMPEEEMGFQPADGMLTFHETAQHILQSGHILTGLLLDGETNLATPAYRESFPRYIAQLPDTSTRDRLAQALREEVERRVTELGGQPPTFWEQLMTRFDSQQVTRLEMLQFVKEHELTHRSQLFMYQRLKGIVPVTTRRRLAKQSAK